MLNVRLYEIFTSIEGEGVLFGTKTLFVRLAGCPFGCYYCDTEEALPADSGEEHTMEEACRMIDDAIQPNTYKVNFTGGEPLVQHEAVAGMARHVQSSGVPTYLESSCYDADRFRTVIPHIDIVKVEFKTADSAFVEEGQHPRIVRSATECLRAAVDLGRETYIKVVAGEGTKPGPFAELVGGIFSEVSNDDISGFVIQPVTGPGAPTLDALLELHDIVRPYSNKVRVIPQLHKAIGAP
ncbi:organic radical activating enzyme [Cenarchaeum symbiosum A]|uniref:7-carboxy-7-deazaguanine synthase n=1 Tax=Cenarchaeum symbiosum (strain A) TaxID=414004 RepID=A0RYT4_CENSY|nr:organic radical activating enzyme [Cenarchaeum symbiosum A]